ncbi:hypothetical protein B0H11DRAFT_2264986 [Mycena galericulata]|nr:hypothetical protein B0H11DRAFT_2264986 [Mycena galericulata]
MRAAHMAGSAAAALAHVEHTLDNNAQRDVAQCGEEDDGMCAASLSVHVGGEDASGLSSISGAGASSSGFAP